jgi:hypothetical protein
MLLDMFHCRMDRKFRRPIGYLVGLLPLSWAGNEGTPSSEVVHLACLL